MAKSLAKPLIISPTVLDFLEQARQVAVSFEGAEEYFPWGNRGFFRDIKGRNFLFLKEQPDYLDITVRLVGAAREVAINQPYVENPKEMGERGWITARVRTQAELDAVLPWISLSYELNKPFRTQEDALPGEKPEILGFLEKIRQLAFSYSEVEENFPYGDRAFRLIKGKIFVYASEHEDYLYVNVRLPLGEREYALSLPFVEVPKYIGHKGWIGAKVSTLEELETVIPWVQVSYDVNHPPKKKRAKPLS